MKTANHLVLPAVITLALLLAPTLCVSGTLQHSCTECPESISCDHEDDCPSDPCSGPALRQNPGSGAVELGFGPVLHVGPAVPPAERPACRPSPPAPPAPDRGNLPSPPSALPLLI